MSRQNSVPALVLPAPNPPNNTTPSGLILATSQNMNALIRWAKTVSPRMLFADGAWCSDEFSSVAPPTAPSDAYLVGGGVQGVSFSSGDGTLTFPVAFPNGLLAFLALSNSPSITVGWDLTASTTNAAIQMFASGSHSGTLQVSYVALGW